MSYIDKLLSDIQLEFRDKYKDDLDAGRIRNFEFNEEFNRLLRDAELASKSDAKAGKKMRTFEESKKSQKTVASLKIDKNEGNKSEKKTSKSSGKSKGKAETVEGGDLRHKPS